MVVFKCPANFVAMSRLFLRLLLGISIFSGCDRVGTQQGVESAKEIESITSVAEFRRQIEASETDSEVSLVTFAVEERERRDIVLSYLEDAALRSEQSELWVIRALLSASNQGDREIALEWYFTHRESHSLKRGVAISAVANYLSEIGCRACMSRREYGEFLEKEDRHTDL